MSKCSHGNHIKSCTVVSRSLQQCASELLIIPSHVSCYAVTAITPVSRLCQKKHDQSLGENDAKYSVVTVLGMSDRVANFRLIHTEGSRCIVTIVVANTTGN